MINKEAKLKKKIVKKELEKFLSKKINRIMLTALPIATIWILIDIFNQNLSFNLLHDTIVLVAAIVLEPFINYNKLFKIKSQA